MKMTKGIKGIELNWGVVEGSIKEKDWTLKDLAVAMGFSDNYMSVAKAKNSFPKDKLAQLSMILGEEEDTLISTEASTYLPESDFEKEVRMALKNMQETINLLMEVVGNIEAEVKNRPKAKVKPDTEKAKELLNKMVRDTGSCKYADFESALKILGIGKEVIKDAVETCGCITSMQGYGNNKCKWITRTRDGGIYRDSDVKVVGE